MSFDRDLWNFLTRRQHSAHNCYVLTNSGVAISVESKEAVQTMFTDCTVPTYICSGWQTTQEADDDHTQHHELPLFCQSRTEVTDGCYDWFQAAKLPKLGCIIIT